MPKKQKATFNGSGLKKRFGKFLNRNGAAIANGVGITAMIGVVGGLFGTLIFGLESSSREHNFFHGIKNDVNGALKIEVDELDYEMTGSSQITHTQGGGTYRLDFNTGYVTIDNPGEENDVIIPFDEFANPDFIERAKAAGLQISAAFNDNVDAALSEEEQAWLSKEGDNQNAVNTHLEDMRDRTEAFQRKYGLGG